MSGERGTGVVYHLDKRSIIPAVRELEGLSGPLSSTAGGTGEGIKMKLYVQAHGLAEGYELPLWSCRAIGLFRSARAETPSCKY